MAGIAEEEVKKGKSKGKEVKVGYNCKKNNIYFYRLS